MKLWIGVDLDGTLAVHTSGDKIGTIGPPVPRMLERVKSWLEAGVTVKIVTARVYEERAWGFEVAKNAMEVEAQHHMIRNWTIKHLGVALEATASKDFAMFELWDDRAVGVERNTGRIREIHDGNGQDLPADLS